MTTGSPNGSPPSSMTRAGRSPFSPDKEHLHHRMLEIGHSHRRAVLIMWLWAGLIAFGGVLASLYASRLTTAVLAVWVVLTVVLTFVLARVFAEGTLMREDLEGTI